MRNLIDFLFKYGYCFLFVGLECLALILLFRFNSYQGSVGFTSANRVVGQIYTLSAEVSSFFQLRTVNDALTSRNIELEAENEALRRALQGLRPDSGAVALSGQLQADSFRIISARVISNSLNRPDNYLTLDKGTADGVKPEMGVVSGTGIVGIVYATSSHYSLVMSLLSHKSSISCKFKHNDYFGYLKWREGDVRYAYLEDVPRHALFQQGDTIVTSGHSAVFPKGITVGTVERISDSKDGMSYLLRIRLSTDFACLDNVIVVSDERREELAGLEKQPDVEP